MLAPKITSWTKYPIKFMGILKLISSFLPKERNENNTSLATIFLSPNKQLNKTIFKLRLKMANQEWIWRERPREHLPKCREIITFTTSKTTLRNHNLDAPPLDQWLGNWTCKEMRSEFFSFKVREKEREIDRESEEREGEERNWYILYQ